MNNRRLIFYAVVIVVLGVLGVLGYMLWYQPTYDFFTTTDASVTGTFTSVPASASGQVYDLFADAGTRVKKGDVLATIKVTSAASGSTLLAYVTSPISGTVSARNVTTGETIAAGQPVENIVDLSQLWVVVNVEENRVNEVHVGQTADVAIGDVGQTFRGQVAEIGSATNNVLSPSLSLTSSSDTTQKVPVKIMFDYSSVRLVPGMGATVTIYTHATPK